MRIDRSRKKKPGLTQSAQGGGKRKAIFATELQKTEQQILKQELSDLWRGLEEASSRVRRSLAYPDWVAYRTKIEEFLQFVRQAGYSTQVREGFTLLGHHYSYTVIEAIDEKLQEISVAFLRENQDKIGLLAKLDELRGMLLDLYA